jgi:hypothetical protein
LRHLVSYMFTSLDGLIADADGELDWVPIDDELMGFANEYFGGTRVFGGGVVLHDYEPEPLLDPEALPHVISSIARRRRSPSWDSRSTGSLL